MAVLYFSEDETSGYKDLIGKSLKAIFLYSLTEGSLTQSRCVPWHKYGILSKAYFVLTAM
jgi:hypothetical protein